MKRNLLHLAAALAVFGLPSLQADQPSRLELEWSLLPGDRDYITSGGTERGMAVNPVEGHLYIVSRADSNELKVAVLDASNGTELGFLNTSGISGGIFDLNMIAVAADGAIFAANLTRNPGGDDGPFKLYRWADQWAAPVNVYSGDPGMIPGRRWGDALAVHGAGDDTRVLITSHHTSLNNSLITILHPAWAGATDFFSERWLTEDLNLALGIGLSFVDATTFYGTSVTGTLPRGLLHRITFDLASGDTTTTTFSDEQFDRRNSIIGFDVETGMLIAAAPAADGLPTRVSVYDAAGLEEAAGPLQVVPLEVSNSTAGGTGSIQFHDGRVYVLLSNNGLHVYQYTELTELELWRLEHFGTINNEGAAANNVDTAGDGLSNLTKFALGLDPHLPARDRSPLAEIRSVYPEEFAWNLEPGDHDFLTTGGTERGMAYNPVTGNIYIVSRALNTIRVAILDGGNGAHTGFLDVSGIIDAGGTFDLNMIGVADDGAIYAGNLTTNAGGADGPYRLYRWADEEAAPVEVYSGHPGANAGGRWGDNLAVRGAGTATEVLILSHSTNAAVFSQQTILRPTDSSMTSFTPTPLVPVTGSTGIGTAFGAGDVFWATRGNIPLNEVAFDLAGGEATLLRSFGTTSDGGTVTTVDATLVGLGFIGVHTQKNLLAGVRSGTANLYLYDLTALEEGQANTPLHIHALPTSNSTVGGGSGDMAFTNDRVFAMHVNNGIVALDIDPVDFGALTFTRPALPPGGIDYIVEVSSDLTNWDPESAILVAETPAAEGMTRVTYRDSEPMSVHDRRFMRLRIVERPE